MRLTPEQVALLQKVEGLAAEVQTLEERMKGIWMTPKELQDERYAALHAELKVKLAEYDAAVAELKAAIPSPTEA